MDGVYGLVSNALGIFMTHPIDVVKTNYQLNQLNQLNQLKSAQIKSNISTVEIVKNIWKTRGVKGFCVGVIPNLSTYPGFWFVYFGSNQVLGDRCNITKNKYYDKFITSYISSTLGSTVTNPLFVIKSRMQNTLRNELSIMSAITNINKNGYSTYFRGLNATFLNNIKIAFQFPMYDYIKDKTKSVTLASFGSKAICSTIFYPLDLVRVIQRNSDTKLKIPEIMKSIHKNKGPFGLYKGVLLYNAVSTPNFVIMMLSFEFLKKHF
jgi:hypothetical protein